MQAAGERLHHRRHLGRHARRDREQVRAGDPLGHEYELGVGAVEEREEVLAQRLLTATAGVAGAARSRVRGDDTPAGRHVEAAELMPERAGWRPEQQRMAAPECLQVGAVGERHLDLDDDVAFCHRLGPGDVLEPQVARAVEDERPHPRAR